MKALVSITLMMVAVATAGCGYSTTPLISPSYKTITVNIFKNETRYREFEFDLTNALKNEITSKTNLTIVRREEAETELSGKILSYEQHVVTEGAHKEVRELEVKIVLAFEWKDLKTGQTIHSQSHFTRSASAKFPLGQTRESAATEVLNDVAADIINDLEAEW